MSYSKTTWANGDTITSTKLNNAEDGIDKATPVYVPFTLTESEGTLTVTTTATFSDVKAAVVANKLVIAVVQAGDITVYLPMTAKSPVADPTEIWWDNAINWAGAESTPEPAILCIGLTSSGAIVKNIPLTVAT